MKHKVISLLLIAAITVCLLPFAANDAAAAPSLPPDDDHIFWIEGAIPKSNGEYTIFTGTSHPISGLVPDNPMFVGLVLAKRGAFDPCTWQYADMSNALACPCLNITPSQDDNYKFSIRGSRLDTGIRFATLGPGKYTLYLYSLPYSGAGSYTPCIDSIDFEVVQLGVDLSKFSSNITYGKAYGVPGTIKSNEKITKVVASVIDPNVGTPAFYRSNFYVSGRSMGGRVVTTTWYSPNGTTLNLSGSPIDANIYFAGLARGQYIFRVTVYLKSGTSFSGEKQFTVK